MIMILPSHTAIQHNTIHFFAIILVNTIPTALSRVQKYLDSQELRVLSHRQFLHCKHIYLLDMPAGKYAYYVRRCTKNEIGMRIYKNIK